MLRLDVGSCDGAPTVSRGREGQPATPFLIPLFYMRTERSDSYSNVLLRLASLRKWRAVPGVSIS